MTQHDKGTIIGMLLILSPILLGMGLAFLVVVLGATCHV